MSASADLQIAVAAALGAANALRVPVPIVARRQKELGAEIEAAWSNHGLCVWVMPPLPTRALEGVPFVFFEGAEIRCRIIEQPAANTLGADAYDLLDDVATALHWTNPGGILAHPLQLAPRPVEMVEDERSRIIDVVFHATYQLDPA